MTPTKEELSDYLSGLLPTFEYNKIKFDEEGSPFLHNFAKANIDGVRELFEIINEYSTTKEIEIEVNTKIEWALKAMSINKYNGDSFGYYAIYRDFLNRLRR